MSNAMAAIPAKQMSSRILLSTLIIDSPLSKPLFAAGFRMLGEEFEDVRHAGFNDGTMVRSGNLLVLEVHLHFLHRIDPHPCVDYRNSSIGIALDNQHRHTAILDPLKDHGAVIVHQERG